MSNWEAIGLERARIIMADVDRALGVIRAGLRERIRKHGPGQFVSPHEAYGTMAEEWREVEDAVRTGPDSALFKEIVDLIVPAVVAMVSMPVQLGVDARAAEFTEAREEAKSDVVDLALAKFKAAYLAEERPIVRGRMLNDLATVMDHPWAGYPDVALARRVQNLEERLAEAGVRYIRLRRALRRATVGFLRMKARWLRAPNMGAMAYSEMLAAWSIAMKVEGAADRIEAGLTNP